MFNDARGFKTADAPRNWPFGMDSPERARAAESREALERFRAAHDAYIIKFRAHFGTNPESIKWHRPHSNATS